jgi:hypothetical protein
MKFVIIQSWEKSKYLYLGCEIFAKLPPELKFTVSSFLFDYEKIDIELRKKISYRVDVLK